MAKAWNSKNANVPGNVQAKATFNILMDWNLVEKVAELVFDTASSGSV